MIHEDFLPARSVAALFSLSVEYRLLYPQDGPLLFSGGLFWASRTGYPNDWSSCRRVFCAIPRRDREVSGQLRARGSSVIWVRECALKTERSCEVLVARVERPVELALLIVRYKSQAARNLSVG